MSGCLEPRLYDQRWSCLARLSSTVPQQRIRIKSRANEENGTKEEEAAGNLQDVFRHCRGLCWSHLHVGDFRAGLCWLSWALLVPSLPEIPPGPLCCPQHVQETLPCSNKITVCRSAVFLWIQADAAPSYGTIGKRILGKRELKNPQLNNADGAAPRGPAWRHRAGLHKACV